MSAAAGGVAFVVILLVAIAAFFGWFAFAQLRARRLGLPLPSLSSYFSRRPTEDQYGAPRPAPGGVVGWFSDQVRKLKDRNSRSAAGAYEQSLHDGTGRGRRGFGPLDPDEAWDARVGHEADGYGYYEEQELSGTGRGQDTEYAGGGSYNISLAPMPTAADNDERRGRPQTRSPVGQRNPFDDDAAASLRGMSPRPIDTVAKSQKHRSRGELDSAGSSPIERRSIFRENV